MNGWDEDGADAHCVRCGAQICFDTGWGGPFDCPSCGKPWEFTDEELADKNRKEEEYAAKLKTDEFWISDMERQLDSMITGIDFMFCSGLDYPYKARDKAKWLANELRKLKAKLKT